MSLPSKKSTEHVESAHDQDGDRRIKKDEPNKATDEARNKRLLRRIDKHLMPVVSV